MYFYELIKEQAKNEEVVIFVDMDGVIASYNFGKPLDFKTKRPLKTNIGTLEKISTLKNVELYILSVCKKDFQIKDKNDWLDKYAPFFKKENRIVLSKETITNTSSSNMKLQFLKDFKTDKKKILVDDDNEVLKTISDGLDDIILYQDSELID